jgi:hypothetical protein
LRNWQPMCLSRAGIKTKMWEARSIEGAANNTHRGVERTLSEGRLAPEVGWRRNTMGCSVCTAATAVFPVSARLQRLLIVGCPLSASSLSSRLHASWISCLVSFPHFAMRRTDHRAACSLARSWLPKRASRYPSLFLLQALLVKRTSLAHA